MIFLCLALDVSLEITFKYLLYKYPLFCRKSCYDPIYIISIFEIRYIFIFLIFEKIYLQKMESKLLLVLEAIMPRQIRVRVNATLMPGVRMCSDNASEDDGKGGSIIEVDAERYRTYVESATYVSLFETEVLNKIAARRTS